LIKAPTLNDVLSIYAGLRPLVSSSESQKTASISRDHRIVVSSSGLITITGGKWTTYRKMAEDVVNQAELVGELTQRRCRTSTLQIHGWTHESIAETNLIPYGSDAQEIRTLIRLHPNLGQPLHPKLNYQQAEVIWQIRHEMARQVEDVLARRTRSLFLNARASVECAPVVAQLMAQELELKQEWIDTQLQTYQELAEGYEKLKFDNL
jgi:glycerol-3-phosphate dehydrogenase